MVHSLHLLNRYFDFMPGTGIPYTKLAQGGNLLNVNKSYSPGQKNSHYSVIYFV
jgi:hypothetical protein